MTRQRLMVMGLTAALASLVACVDSGVDAVDGGGACAMQVISVIPGAPVVGQMVVVQGSIDTGSPGLQVYNWAIDLGGADVSFMPEGTTDAREIFFEADAAGSHAVTLTGSVAGTACTDASRTIEVAAAARGEEAHAR